jgi:hypothetical protein
MAADVEQDDFVGTQICLTRRRSNATFKSKKNDLLNDFRCVVASLREKYLPCDFAQFL